MLFVCLNEDEVNLGVIAWYRRLFVCLNRDTVKLGGQCTGLCVFVSL